MTAATTEFSSAKLFYPADDWVNGMDVEFVRTGENLNAYLQVHSHPIAVPSSVTLHAEGATCSLPSSVHQGGQRIVLPPLLQDFLLSSLKEGKSVTIEIPGYKATIPARGFKNRLQEMEHPPFNNPFKLPF